MTLYRADNRGRGADRARCTRACTRKPQYALRDGQASQPRLPQRSAYKYLHRRLRPLHTDGLGRYPLLGLWLLALPVGHCRIPPRSAGTGVQLLSRRQLLKPDALRPRNALHECSAETASICTVDLCNGCDGGDPFQCIDLPSATSIPMLAPVAASQRR